MKVCIIPPEKPVEQAKVTFDYDADNEDELTIRVRVRAPVGTLAPNTTSYGFSTCLY